MRANNLDAVPLDNLSPVKNTSQLFWALCLDALERSTYITMRVFWTRMVCTRHPRNGSPLMGSATRTSLDGVEQQSDFLPLVDCGAGLSEAVAAKGKQLGSAACEAVRFAGAG